MELHTPVLVPDRALEALHETISPRVPRVRLRVLWGLRRDAFRSLNEIELIPPIDKVVFAAEPETFTLDAAALPDATLEERIVSTSSTPRGPPGGRRLPSTGRTNNSKGVKG